MIHGAFQECGMSAGTKQPALPMIYAAAWNTTGNDEYHQLYRKYIGQAIRQSFMIEDRTTTYALLQVQCSLELLLSLEQEPELINQNERNNEGGF